jgi:branched-chain amino acid transport system substrate-binding protein
MPLRRRRISAPRTGSKASLLLLLFALAALVLAACGEDPDDDLVTGPDIDDDDADADDDDTDAVDDDAPVVRMAGWWALTGPVQAIGIGSEAVAEYTQDLINDEGGIELADGTMAQLEIEVYDTACDPEEGLSLIREIEDSDALVALGPTCSSVAEPVFGLLQSEVDDDGDSGPQIPVLTDTAVKVGLGALSEWVFRNVPNEEELYDVTFEIIAEEFPDAQTVAAGVESDFAHSASTHEIITNAAENAGFEVVEEVEWLWDDVEFSTQGRQLAAAEADIVTLASHPLTTCGVAQELARQGVEPEVMVGLTSSATLETVRGCADEVEGMLIPTSFAPVDEEAEAISEDITTEYEPASFDLHSSPVYENLRLLQDIIADSGIEAQADTVEEDRRRIRDALADVEEFEGFLGTVTFGPDGDADKPWVIVEISGGEFEVWRDVREE